MYSVYMLRKEEILSVYQLLRYAVERYGMLITPAGGNDDDDNRVDEWLFFICIRTWNIGGGRLVPVSTNLWVGITLFYDFRLFVLFTPDNVWLRLLKPFDELAIISLC